MKLISEKDRFEQKLLQRDPQADLSSSHGKYIDPFTEAAWAGWSLKTDAVGEGAYERALSAPRVASPIECVLEAVRHVLIAGDAKDGDTVLTSTNAWLRLTEAYRQVHPALSVPFPNLVSITSLALNSKAAFDLVCTHTAQSKMSESQRALALAMFEHGLIFATLHPEARAFSVPLSQDGTSVFVDGAGLVPLDFASAEDQQHNPKGLVLEFGYTNYRGEFGNRKVIPIRIFQDINEYHKEDQWLLEAYDLDKESNRVFAIQDISNFIKTKKD